MMIIPFMAMIIQVFLMVFLELVLLAHMLLLNIKDNFILLELQIGFQVKMVMEKLKNL